MLPALILKMPEHFGKKIQRFSSNLKKIKIQELTNHVNNLFIHESKMEQNIFANVRL